ncbi:MAG: hypothetical protein JSV97_07640 [candidate division WOR-3 bacterium]|nr:MAG: hypothetical protein JSV97_07640 [candidate division WOR-3 bacterium]
MIKKCIIVAFLVMISCRHADEFKKIREGNFDIVEKDTYRGTPVYMGQGGDYKELVTSLRLDIEKNIDLLPFITKNFFSVEYELSYRFKFAAVDREKSCLILRYFARIPDHPLYAGYQIQFVFDMHTKKLLKVFTAEVPLE